MCEETLEAHLAGSETSTTLSEETPHERISAVPRQSESQVAHDSWGSSARPGSMPDLRSSNDTVTGSSVTNSDLELQLDGNIGHTFGLFAESMEMAALVGCWVW